MNTLIIYYSLEGNIEFISRSIAKSLNADLYKVEPKKAYPKKGLAKFLHGGSDSIKHVKPELVSPLPDLSKYELILIGCPVWAGRPAAPMNTVLDGLDFAGKKIAIFVSSAGGSSQKTIQAIAAGAKNAAETVASFSLKNPLQHPSDSLRSVEEFINRLK